MNHATSLAKLWLAWHSAKQYTESHANQWQPSPAASAILKLKKTEEMA